MGGKGQLLSLLLHVLYCHLDGCGYNLESDEETSVFSDQSTRQDLDKQLLFITTQSQAYYPSTGGEKLQYVVLQ